MSNSNPPHGPDEEMSPEEFMSALFANLVMQQTNMAYIFLGRSPHPDTGQVVRDFETARFFIEQLEMLAVKTKGNLDKREEGLLQQSLTGLRMAFVEAVEQGGTESGTPPVSSATTPEPGPKASAEQPETTPSAVSEAPATAAGEAAPQEDESRKKFSKKY
jgi:hypothetical protein